MTLFGSSRRQQSSEATRGSQTDSSTLVSDPQNRSVLGSASSKGGLAPSPEEDDHLTIKKLKTQNAQSPNPLTHTPSIPSSIPVQITPSASVHTTKTTPQTQIPVVDLDSDEEQGLQSNVLNLLANPQPAKSSAVQPRAKQTLVAEPPIAEPSQTEKTTTAELAVVDSTRAE